LLELLEAFVGVKDVLNNNGSVVEHGCVQNLVEPRLQAGILEGVRAMNPVEWNSSLKNCVFQLGPINEFGLDAISDSFEYYIRITVVLLSSKHIFHELNYIIL
jgi:hypothetical protein